MEHLFENNREIVKLVQIFRFVFPHEILWFFSKQNSRIAFKFLRLTCLFSSCKDQYSMTILPNADVVQIINKIYEKQKISFETE